MWIFIWLGMVSYIKIVYAVRARLGVRTQCESTP